MRAKIINKENEYYGQNFIVSKVFDKFVALRVNGKIVDFGKSEIKIIAKTEKELYILGSFLLSMPIQGGKNGLMRHSEIIKYVKKIDFPANKNLMTKAISFYLWT